MYVEKIKTFYVSSPSEYYDYIILANENTNEYALYEISHSEKFLNDKIEDNIINETEGTDIYVVFEKINNSFTTSNFKTEYLVFSGMKQNSEFQNDFNQTDFDWRLFLIILIPVILGLLIIAAICFCCYKNKKSDDVIYLKKK